MGERFLQREGHSHFLYAVAPKLRTAETPLPVACIRALERRKAIHDKKPRREAILRRNLLVYGLGGLVAPFGGIWLIDRARHASPLLVVWSGTPLRIR